MVNQISASFNKQKHDGGDNNTLILDYLDHNHDLSTDYD